ncbi:MAG TPA: hypothetical protein VMU51_34155 [Mycobacteriales bacterium]|nr:hypothetical protein [Mycobacteriales bacterium]
MTLTVPTWDLVGVIADCVPFAHPDDELPMLHGVRVEWDGRMLHALATDQLRIACSSWHPDDDPGPGQQDHLLSRWGGPADPWGVFLTLDDAKKLVSVYKLPAKQARAPLTVEVDLARLTVRRASDTGHPAIAAAFDGLDVDFPDVRRLLAKAASLERVDQVAFSGTGLADFGRVRQVAPLELRFTGPTSLAHVAIGSRFTGGILPVKLGKTASGRS